MKQFNNSNTGQVVLMLVLITIVGLTIGLSLISRTVTDIRISSQIEQSGRAFSAAEAGVENALKSATVNQTGNVTLPDASGTYSISQLGNSSSVLSFSVTAPANTQTVWLIDHKDDGTLNEDGYSYPAGSSFDICWGIDPNSTPAMVISLFYKIGSSYKIARGAYDQNAAGRGNGFSSVDSAGNYCGSNFRFKKTINPESDFEINPATSKLLFLRLQPVYENTTIAVKPSDINPSEKFPVQGKIITSVGQTTTGVVRKIQVIQGYNVVPEILDFGFFGENQQ